jgi:hypothetical protein
MLSMLIECHDFQYLKKKLTSKGNTKNVVYTKTNIIITKTNQPSSLTNNKKKIMKSIKQQQQLKVKKKLYKTLNSGLRSIELY